MIFSFLEYLAVAREKSDYVCSFRLIKAPLHELPEGIFVCAGENKLQNL